MAGTGLPSRDERLYPQVPGLAIGRAAAGRAGCRVGRSDMWERRKVGSATAVRRLAWAFDHQDVDVLRGLLSDDFLHARTRDRTSRSARRWISWWWIPRRSTPAP